MSKRNYRRVDKPPTRHGRATKLSKDSILESRVHAGSRSEWKRLSNRADRRTEKRHASTDAEEKVGSARGFDRRAKKPRSV